jgi:hypothetical protein
MHIKKHRRFSRNKRKSSRHIKRKRRYSNRGAYLAALSILLGLGIYYKYNNNQGNNQIKNVLKQIQTEKISREEQIANKYGYTIKYIKGDGACMFRSIADQIEGNDNKHSDYRRQSVEYIKDISSRNEQIRENLEIITRGEYNQTLEEYLKNMNKPNTWGDQIMLQGLSNILNKKIIIIQFDSVKQKNEIVPINFETSEEIPSSNPDIVIGLYGENHYVSLYKIKGNFIL